VAAGHSTPNHRTSIVAVHCTQSATQPRYAKPTALRASPELSLHHRIHLDQVRLHWCRTGERVQTHHPMDIRFAISLFQLMFGLPILSLGIQFSPPHKVLITDLRFLRQFYSSLANSHLVLRHRINDSDKPGLLTARAQQALPYLGVPSYYWCVFKYPARASQIVSTFSFFFTPYTFVILFSKIRGTNCIGAVENGAHGESIQCPNETCATHFPNPPNIMSTFNTSAMEAIAAAMSTELRAFYNVGAARGLDCWGPVINLVAFRPCNIS